MNDAHLHLLLNHTPILGTLFGVLVLGYALISKSRGALKVGLTTLLLTTLLTMPAHITGEGAEGVVENLPGISHEAIKAHEEVSDWAMWGTGLAGTAALLGLLTLSKKSSRDKQPKSLALVSLVLGIVAFGLMVWTGLTGGLIRHSELHDVAPVEKVAPPVKE